MGGFFSAPSQPAPPAPPQSQARDPEDEGRKIRLDTISRNRRGRQGMIATSERGVLSPAGGSTKTLLGE